MEATELQKALLKMVVDDAKQRVLFYYRDMVGEEVSNKIETLLNSYNYGFDFDYPNAVAYCKSSITAINVTKEFYDINNYEQQVGVMIHEMHHAISYANKNNQQVESLYGDASYVSSYKLIEEGLADISSELVMNYYYDKKNPRVNYEPFRNEGYYCGYSVERNVIKTLLAIMESIGIDKKMLYEYYFGHKEAFFDKIVQIGGKDIFKYIQISSTEKKHYGYYVVPSTVSYELYKVINKSQWGELLSRIGSHKLYKEAKYDNVYYKENGLLESIHISYCIEQLISKLNIDIDHITASDIDKLYNETNGLITQAIQHLVVPPIIERIIISWFKNCKKEEVHYIKKLIPDIYSILNIYEFIDGVYCNYLFDKVLDNKEVKDVSDEDMSLLLEELYSSLDGNEDLFLNEIQDNGYITICFLNFPYIVNFSASIFSKMSKEQKERLRRENETIYKICELLEVYIEFFKLYDIEEVDQFDSLNMNETIVKELIEYHPEFINRIKELHRDDIIKAIVETGLSFGLSELMISTFPEIMDNTHFLEMIDNEKNLNEAIMKILDSYLERDNLEQLSGNNLRIVLHEFLTIFDSYRKKFSEFDFCNSLLLELDKYPYIVKLIKDIYPKLSDEQKEIIEIEHEEFSQTVKKYNVYQEFLDVFSIHSIHEMPEGPFLMSKLNEFHSELLDRIRELDVAIIIDSIIEKWIRSFYDPMVLLKYFPDAFTRENGRFLSLAKDWGYDYYFTSDMIDEFNETINGNHK